MAQFHKSLLPIAATLVLAACQAGEPAGPAPERVLALNPGGAQLAADGIANFEQFEVCKRGASGTFSYTADQRITGPGVDVSGTFTLAADECILLGAIDGLGSDVSVTETGSQSGYHFDRAVVTTVTGAACANPSYTTTTVGSTTVTGTMSGALGDGVCDGTLVEFVNAPNETLAEGRMTGGGSQIIIGDVRVTRGFTIHCDIVLSNNVEVNWGGNRWHLDKPLTSARCVDDPSIEPAPPPAPFDTFYGEGIGRLNGVDGSLIRFVFIDAGEPGGRNDRASIQIFDAGGALVLDVPMSFLNRGNLQAHYDQPHK